MNFDAYRSDARTNAAVERKLLIIREAAIRLATMPKRCARLYPGEMFVALATGSATNTTGSNPKPSGTRSQMICRF